jgi:hypothetical protein
MVAVASLRPTIGAAVSDHTDHAKLPELARRADAILDDRLRRIASALCVNNVGEFPCKTCEDAALRVYTKRQALGRVLRDIETEARANR